MGHCFSCETIPSCYYCQTFIRQEQYLLCELCEMEFHLHCMLKKKKKLQPCPLCYNNTLKLITIQGICSKKESRSSFIKNNDDMK